MLLFGELNCLIFIFSFLPLGNKFV